MENDWIVLVVFGALVYSVFNVAALIPSIVFTVFALFYRLVEMYLNRSETQIDYCVQVVNDMDVQVADIVAHELKTTAQIAELSEQVDRMMARNGLKEAF